MSSLWPFRPIERIDRFGVGLALLGWASVAHLAWLCLFDSGVTFHSVDTIRDFRVAQAIASGEHFPLASQPWAGRYQTLPAYLYLLAVPVLYGADEITLMRIVGVVCLLAIWRLRRSLLRALGRNVANAYPIIAVTVTGGIFAHSIGNTALAMATSALLLAALVDMYKPRRYTAVTLVFLAALLPQLHLSGLPISMFALAAALWVYPREMLQPAPLGAMMVLGVLCAIWLVVVGPIAPEAYSSANGAANAPGTALLAMLMRWGDPGHWLALLSSFTRFVSALQPSEHLSRIALRNLSMAVGVFTLLCTALAVGGSLLLAQRGHRCETNLPNGRPIVAVALLSLLLSAGYLSSWGIWYFDALWPWVGTLVAVALAHFGIARQAASEAAHRGARCIGLALAGALFLSSALPLYGLHRALKVDGELIIRTDGVFYPISAVPPERLVQMSAATQVRLFTKLRELTLCNAQSAAGLLELYLRDFTARDAWHGCATRPHAAPLASPVLVLRDGEPFREPRPGDAAPLFAKGRIQLIKLPVQRVEIGPERRSQVAGHERVRYTLFRPASIPAGTAVLAEGADVSRDDMRFRLALRCLAPLAQPHTLLFSANATPDGFQLLSAETILGVHYYLIESTVVGRRFAYATSRGIDCDAMGYLVYAGP